MVALQLAGQNNIVVFTLEYFSHSTNKLTRPPPACSETVLFHILVISFQFSVASGSKLNWIWIKLCHTAYPWSGRFSHQVTQIWETKLWEKLYFLSFVLQEILELKVPTLTEWLVWWGNRFDSAGWSRMILSCYLFRWKKYTHQPPAGSLNSYNCLTYFLLARQEWHNLIVFIVGRYLVLFATKTRYCLSCLSASEI